MIDDNERTIHALRRAMAAQVRGHHLNPEIATVATGRLGPDAGSARRRPREYVAIAACLVGVAAVALVYAVTRSGAGTKHAVAPPADSTCNGAVVTSALPVWARSGFSPNAYVNPHVTGTNGDIIGVLFTNPLRSPPAKGRNNKILWVAKDPGNGPLVIRAQLDRSKHVITREIAGGPGPSIINLPAAGCWHMTLT
jgi:hypothetical protein